ncbi:MAG: flavodoxin domain-containing protein [Deltaproteobacteria bacterium]|nr:flavodoxin domain-containing protein [Deltaproteobacteria bacterium]
MLEITRDLYWVGAKDWELRTFHGRELSTHRGSTYNSYLLRDEKTVLFDTVWNPFREEFVARLARDPGLDRIDLIVVNHGETDHSGALKLLLSKMPKVPVYCTGNGEKILRKHFHEDWDFRVVKTGDRLKTGKYELLFFEMPMLHWPDSMMTYIEGTGVLVSNDAFGQHYAARGMFNDEVDECELYEEALKYYANILTPFNAQMRKKLQEFGNLELPIEMICPSHGVLWREDPRQIITKYAEWSEDYQEDQVAVLYDTMWNGTKAMAEAIAAGLAAEGLPVRVFNTSRTDKNDVVTEVFRSRAIVVGSPTVNRTVLYSIAGILDLLAGLRFKGKKAAAFGSYGWSGESADAIHRHLKEAGFEVLDEKLKLKYQPTGDELDECMSFGRRFAAYLNA